MTGFAELFWNTFVFSLQMLTILAGVLAAVSAVMLAGFLVIGFIRGAYLAAVGKPMPPKPPSIPY